MNGLGATGLGLPGRWISSESPAALVQEGVVVAAHQEEVVQCGWSAVVSGDYVVYIAPVPRPVAAVKLAVVVAYAKGSALGWRDVGDGGRVVQDS